MRTETCELGVGHLDFTDMIRFTARIRVQPNDGCWHFVAANTGDDRGAAGDYYQFQAKGIRQAAHRVSYELFFGRIPPGMELDHLCRNTICVRPTHLEPTTHTENQLRGTGFVSTNANKTECVKGHKYTLESTGYDSRHKRFCLICKKERYLSEYANRTQAEKDAKNARRQERRKLAREEGRFCW